QQPAELLVLDQADLAVVQLLDGEGVLGVEDTRPEYPAEPAQLLTGSGLQHGRLEGHGAAAHGLHTVGQLLAGPGRAVSLGDERVPFGVGGEVGQDLPDPFAAGLDVDLGVKLLCHDSSLANAVSLTIG